MNLYACYLLWNVTAYKCSFLYWGMVLNYLNSRSETSHKIYLPLDDKDLEILTVIITAPHSFDVKKLKAKLDFCQGVLAAMLSSDDQFYSFL